jgi:HK97 family phage portal protein
MGFVSRVLAPFRRKQITAVRGRYGSGWLSVFESYPGAWQQNIVIEQNVVLSNPAVYSCITLIASDIAKLRVRLVEQDAEGIWTETTNPAFTPVLRKPNGFQTRNQFWEQWLLSKLTTGNTYVLKVRDARNVVIRMYVLDPARVMPLIADDGSIFYELMTDAMSPALGGFDPAGPNVRIPARDIIHDRFNCLFHPLVGTSPLLAAGLAATQGVKIQTNSTNLFENRAVPSGILTAPGAISQESADRNKAAWEANYGGANYGRVAVLGDGLKYEPMAMNAVDAQLVEQLNWTSQTVCSCFHVPLYKIGLGQMPTNNNVQALNTEYYSQCLQTHLEAIEEVLDDALGIGWAIGLGTEFDTENLLRMDTHTLMESIEAGIRAGVLSPNEARKQLSLKPVKGGDTPYLQQQNFSLAALDERDKDDPFSKPAAPAIPPPAEPEDEEKGIGVQHLLTRTAEGLADAA